MNQQLHVLWDEPLLVLWFLVCVCHLYSSSVLVGPSYQWVFGLAHLFNVRRVGRDMEQR